MVQLLPQSLTSILLIVCIKQEELMSRVSPVLHQSFLLLCSHHCCYCGADNGGFQPLLGILPLLVGGATSGLKGGHPG